jgi:hypothetical protein
MHHFARQASAAFHTGVACTLGTFFLVFVAFDGDLPAQGKLFHCKRNFQCVPNPCCPWCAADDSDKPFTDIRPGALWKSTVGANVPYVVEPPLASIPGAATAKFLSKDIFHILHLGLVRTFTASVICFLVLREHFLPSSLAKSVPARLQEAYRCFKEFCAIKGKTPDVKYFSKDNLNWHLCACVAACFFFLCAKLFGVVGLFASSCQLPQNPCKEKQTIHAGELFQSFRCSAALAVVGQLL